MIRFVDLRHAEIAGYRFAFWDTATDRFVEAGGDQAWDTLQGFALAAEPEGLDVPRFVALAPEWARHAPPDREIFKVEIPVQVVDSGGGFEATAYNEDRSASCTIPLAPMILEAMAGRSVAYFFGEQTYGVDPSVGAIMGVVAIDFAAEAPEQSW